MVRGGRRRAQEALLRQAERAARLRASCGRRGSGKGDEHQCMDRAGAPGDGRCCRTPRVNTFLTGGGDCDGHPRAFAGGARTCRLPGPGGMRSHRVPDGTHQSRRPVPMRRPRNRTCRRPASRGIVTPRKRKPGDGLHLRSHRNEGRGGSPAEREARTVDPGPDRTGRTPAGRRATGRDLAGSGHGSAPGASDRVSRPAPLTGHVRRGARQTALAAFFLVLPAVFLVVFLAVFPVLTPAAGPFSCLCSLSMVAQGRS